MNSIYPEFLLRRSAMFYTWLISAWFWGMGVNWLFGQYSPEMAAVSVGVLSGVCLLLSGSAIIGLAGGLILSLLTLFFGGLIAAVASWIVQAGPTVAHSPLFVLIVGGILALLAAIHARTWLNNPILMQLRQMINRSPANLLKGFILSVLVVGIKLLGVLGVSWLVIHFLPETPNMARFMILLGIVAGISLVVLIVLLRNIFVALRRVAAGAILALLVVVLSVPVRAVANWILGDGLVFLSSWEGAVYLLANVVMTMYGDNLDKDSDD